MTATTVPTSDRRTTTLLLGAAIIALGIALAGLFIGGGFAKSRLGDRYVTVKGVSEREVAADHAIWPLQVVSADNDLATANRTLARHIAGVRAFMTRHGLDTTQVELTGFSVADAQVNQYSSGAPVNRFVIRQTLLIRSTRPAAVLSASQQIGELAAVGVAVSSSGGEGGGPTFLFSGLNALKPPMIAEATARAREAAAQFATDSRTELAGIRRANQGVFEILARDQAPGISQESQIAKMVRVVSTVEYSLR